MKKWIKAGSRKPKEFVDVLCTDETNIFIGYYITKRHRSPEEMENGWRERNDIYIGDSVVYWHPMPKVPKKD